MRSGFPSPLTSSMNGGNDNLLPDLGSVAACVKPPMPFLFRHYSPEEKVAILRRPISFCNQLQFPSAASW